MCVFKGPHAGALRHPACSAGGRGGPGGPGRSHGGGRQGRRSNHSGQKQDPHRGQERHPQVPLQTAGSFWFMTTFEVTNAQTEGSLQKVQHIADRTPELNQVTVDACQLDCTYTL